MRLDSPTRASAAGGRPMPHVPGVDHRTVEIRSRHDQAVRLHVAEAGTGPPVVLLHGLFGHWYTWRTVLSELADEYRLICVDLRGFGWSQETRSGYDTGGLAADVLALLDELDLDRVHLVGHDLGARVGFHLCLNHPDRVAGFLALNINHPYSRHHDILPNLWRMWFTAFLGYPVLGRWVLRHWPAFTRFLLRRSVADRDVWPPGDLAEFVTAARLSARAGQSVLWQYVVRDIPKLIRGHRHDPRLTVPTLLLGGAADPVIPPSLLRGDDRHVEDMDTRVVDHSGHQLPVEAPTVVAGAIRELFSRTTQRR